MICARCGADTADETCGACGADARLDGRYRLQALLGQGTHGMTWKALRPDDTPVAVKMVNLGAGLAGERRAALDREVAVLRALDHPRIPAMLDDFTTRSGMTRYRCIVQTFVDGPDLAAVVAGRRASVVDVLGWIADIADVLDWLHGLAPPIIHRDIKPQNILRRSDGALVLIDFGSVRDTIVETLGGTMGIGTAGYMAPEQITGDVGPRSDVFALGATAIELLIRRPPHELRERGGRLVWPGDQFPPAVAALVDRMVDPDPTLRPTAAEVRDAARRLAADPDAPAERPPIRLAKVVGPPTGDDSASGALAPVDAMPPVIDRRRRAGRARNALALQVFGAFVGLCAAPFAAEISAWAGLVSAPLSLYAAYNGWRAGSKWAGGVALSVFMVILGLFVVVNLFSIGPYDARAFFPIVLVPYYLLAARPTTRAFEELAAIREAPETGAPLVPTADLPALRRRAIRWSWLSGAAMVAAGLGAFEDIESYMISAPVAAVLGIWTFSRGRLARMPAVQWLGLSMPTMALSLFVAIELFRVSYWDHRHTLAPLMLAYGVLVALGAIAIGFKKPKDDPA